MAGAECVVGALAAAQEACGTVGALDALERPAAAGERLVAITLMTHIPDDAVVGGVEDGVQGHRELDRAEAPGEVSAHAGAELDQVAAELRGDSPQRLARQLAQRRRLVDQRQQGPAPPARELRCASLPPRRVPLTDCTRSVQKSR